MTIHNGAPLYRTNDGRIVAEGDTDAAFLVVGTGGTIPADSIGPHDCSRQTFDRYFHGARSRFHIA